jgi:hypothetical protein
MTKIHEQIMEEMGQDPDAFCEKVIRLWGASKTLVEKYPEYRDDPSDEDLLAWMELNAAANQIVLANASVKARQ